MERLPTKNETPLEQFLKKIENIAKKEQAKGVDHFKGNFNPEDLNEEDMEFYNHYKEGNLSVADVFNRVKELKKSGQINHGREAFMSHIASKMQERILEQG